MRSLFILLVIVVAVSCTSTDKPSTREQAVQDSLNKITMADSSNYTTIQWDSTTQNLGKIKEGSVVEISWHFKNTGNKPLIISQANGTCGCTIADKPEEPIAPGKDGVIKAKFNSQGQGPDAHKTVSVVANTKGQTQHFLEFTATVTKD